MVKSRFDQGAIKLIMVAGTVVALLIGLTKLLPVPGG